MHIDLKTAFLQGESYEQSRDVVCQLPPEAGHPPYICARLKKPAYGMADAPRRWWNVLDGALRSYGMVPTRADRCCYVLYAPKPRERQQTSVAQTGKSRERQRPTMDDKEACQDAVDFLLDPITGSPAHGQNVSGIVNLHVDDLFGVGTNDFEVRVLARLRKDFQVGSEKWNDVEFVGQRIRWTKENNVDFIAVDQEKAICELNEIMIEKGEKDDTPCTGSRHTMFRSVLGQINWLQSRTQFQACYKFSRCASASAAPTVGDIKALNSW